MFLRVADRPVLPRIDLAAQRRRTISRCQRRIVSGVTSKRSPLAPRFRYHGEQGHEQCPVCPVQVRATRLPPLQDGDLVAQDQDLCGPPRSSRRDSRSQEGAGTRMTIMPYGWPGRRRRSHGMQTSGTPQPPRAARPDLDLEPAAPAPRAARVRAVLQRAPASPGNRQRPATARTAPSNALCRRPAPASASAGATVWAASSTSTGMPPDQHGCNYRQGQRPPGLPGPPGRGVNVRVLENLPHCRRRERAAQAGQLAVDAPVSPARVVPRHFQHQRTYRLRGPRPSRRPARIGPPPADQACMPAQQGPRGDDQAQLAELGARSRRPRAARTARSAQDSLGVLTCRWSTATW
jgi:hypothetical protein